jgi:hypothetical protein
MNWAWPTSLDQIWHSLAVPTWLTFPVSLTLVAAGLFAIVMLVTLVRAEKSVANGALMVITLLAIGAALASTIREVGPATSEVAAGTMAPSQSPPQFSAAASPALSCLDEMAGDTVLAACEKVLFGSAESAATAVSYTAARISRLTGFGDVATADRAMTPDLQALRHSIERDRYGLAAYVLLTRDHCTPIDCAAFSSLTDHNQIVANMDERVYDGLITRYAPTWNAPPPVATTAALGPMAALGASVPTGKPTNAEFPSAASTPAVSIMNPEPGTSAAPRATATAAASNTPPPTPRPAPAPHPVAAAPTVAAAARKPPPRPRAPAAPAAPVQIAPAAPAESAPASAASTE